MKRRKLLLLIGGVGFAGFLLATAPARLITYLVPSGVARVGDLTGTLWDGTARVVDINGLQLHDASWQMNPFGVLLGRLPMHVDAKWAGGYARGQVTIGVTGTLRLRDWQAAGPLGPVLRQLNLPGTGGELSIDIRELDLVDRWPTKLIATFRIGRVPLAMFGVSGSLTGDYALEFDQPEVSADGQIPGALSDRGGPVEIAGELRLTPPQNYTIDARIKARDGAPEAIARGLMLAGPLQPDGSHEFRMSGSL